MAVFTRNFWPIFLPGVSLCSSQVYDLTQPTHNASRGYTNKEQHMHRVLGRDSLLMHGTRVQGT